MGELTGTCLQHGRWTPIRFYVFPVDLSVHWSNSMCEYVFNAILHLDKIVLKCLTQCWTWLHCHANLLGENQPMTDCPSRSQWPAPEKKSPMKRKWYSYAVGQNGRPRGPQMLVQFSINHAIIEVPNFDPYSYIPRSEPLCWNIYLQNWVILGFFLCR